MKKRTRKEKVKRPSGLGYLFLAALAIAISICFFSFGEKMLETLAVVIGIIVVLAGTVLATLAISNRTRGLIFGLRIALAVAVLASGIVTLVLRKPAIEVLTNIFALLIIVDGSFKLNSAALSHRSRSRAYVFLIVISVITIACGFLAITYVPRAYMLGLGLLFDALANLFSTFYIPSLLKKMITAGATAKEDDKKDGK